MNDGGHFPTQITPSLSRPSREGSGHMPRPGTVIGAGGLHMPLDTSYPNVLINGFQGIAIAQTALPDQIDIQLDGLQGVVIVQKTYP